MALQSITYQSSKIFYRIIGKGKPVILIHGFGEDGNIWDKQVEFLSAHRDLRAGSGGKDNFKLIIPDLPGSGRSEMIRDMSMEGMAEVVKEILDIELQKEVIIIGHSMGGYITLAFAEKYPQLLSSFGLVHSSALADSEEKRSARLKSIEFIKNNGAYEFLKTAIPGLFGEYWTEDHQPEINTLIEKSKNFTDEAIIQYYRAMIARPDKTHILKNFSRPILLIIGEHDHAVPFAQSMQQTYLPIHSYIHILRNSAHMGMWEETGKVNKALSGFLTWQPR